MNRGPSRLPLHSSPICLFPRFLWFVAFSATFAQSETGSCSDHRPSGAAGAFRRIRRDPRHRADRLVRFRHSFAARMGFKERLTIVPKSVERATYVLRRESHTRRFDVVLAPIPGPSGIAGERLLRAVGPVCDWLGNSSSRRPCCSIISNCSGFSRRGTMARRILRPQRSGRPSSTSWCGTRSISAL